MLRHPLSSTGSLRVGSPASSVLRDAPSPRRSSRPLHHCCSRYRRFAGGNNGASQVPGRPLQTCRVVSSRRRRRVPLDHSGWPPYSFPRRYCLPPRGLRCRPPHFPISGHLARPACSLSTLRDTPSRVPRSSCHARLATGWWSTLAGQGSLSCRVSVCGFCLAPVSLSHMTSSSPRLFLAHPTWVIRRPKLCCALPSACWRRTVRGRRPSQVGIWHRRSTSPADPRHEFAQPLR